MAERTRYTLSLRPIEPRTKAGRGSGTPAAGECAATKHSASPGFADTGPGIDPTLLPRVFDRFFRAAPAGIEGTGLGLAIGKAIAERHGLRLSIGNRTDRSGLRVVVSYGGEPPA